MADRNDPALAPDAAMAGAGAGTGTGSSHHRHDRRVASRDEGSTDDDDRDRNRRHDGGRTAIRPPTSGPPPVAPPAPSRRARRWLPGRRHRTGNRRSRRCSGRPRARVPELIPIRYGRMVASPFAFYRGAAAIMAADLAASPRTGLEVQLCGDAHLSNFGAFAAPDRRLVFSINDFDETPPGPVRVGRQAARRQLRRRRATAGLQRPEAALDRDGRGRRLPAGDAVVRRDELAGGLVHPPRRRRHRPPVRRRRPRQAEQTIRRDDGEGGVEGQPEGVGQAHPGRRRHARVHQRSAGAVAPRGARRTGGSGPLQGHGGDVGAVVQGVAPERPPGPHRALPVRRHRPQGRRRRQRRHAGLGRADARPRSRRPAAAAGQGGPGLGPRAVPRRRAGTRTTASGSSRASA